MVKFYATFILPAFSLIALPALAQTMDDGNASPSVGESFTYNNDNYMAPGDGGAGVSWDFSSLAIDSNYTVGFQTPASTGYANFFPGANIAEATNADSYAFFETSAAGYDLHGVYVVPLTQDVVYFDPERVLSYPCSYNTTWSDDFQADFVSVGFDVARSGTVDALADGYGTLMMPYGNVSNVLRVRNIENYSDVSSLFTIDYEFTTHFFYKPGTHAPLLMIYHQEITTFGNTTTSESLAWLNGGPTGINDALTNAIGMEVYPNPATDRADIVFGTVGGNLDLDVMDVNGRMVMRERLAGIPMGIQRHTMDVSTLPAGVYMLRITAADGQQGSQRLVVQ